MVRGSVLKEEVLRRESVMPSMGAESIAEICFYICTARRRIDWDRLLSAAVTEGYALLTEFVHMRFCSALTDVFYIAIGVPILIK